MGTIYCGPFTAEINEGTRYGHEGYAVQVLHDGTESGHFVLGSFREYRACCDCGWRAAAVHPPTNAGEDAALDQWHTEHLDPLIRAAAARYVVPATVLLDLIAELRRTSARPEAFESEGRLSERETGRFDVIEILESRLEDIAVDRPDQPASRRTGGTW